MIFLSVRNWNKSNTIFINLGRRKFYEAMQAKKFPRKEMNTDKSCY